MTTSKTLREQLKSGLVVAPFVFDGVQAKLAEAAGFEALYMTGFGTAASHGLADHGFIGLGEMRSNLSRIAGAVSVPVIADADTGYGGEDSVRHTVREYIRSGAAALHIEDQEWPKRCGFLEGKRVIPQDEMVLKLQAAVDARGDNPLVIIGRTDALGPHGWDEALTRARVYRDAGADLVFVDGLSTRESIERCARELKGMPLVLNSCIVTVEEAEELGYALYLNIGTMLKLFADFRDSLRTLKSSGSIPLAEDDAKVFAITEMLLNR